MTQENPYDGSDVVARLTADHTGSDAVKSTAVILGAAYLLDPHIRRMQTAWYNRRHPEEAAVAKQQAEAAAAWGGAARSPAWEGTKQEAYVGEITADIINKQFLNYGLKVSVAWPEDIATSHEQMFLGRATVREGAPGIPAGSTCDVRLNMDVVAGTCQWLCSDYECNAFPVEEEAPVEEAPVETETRQEEYVRMITAEIVSKMFVDHGVKVSVTWPDDITTSTEQGFLGHMTVREGAGSVKTGSMCDVRLGINVAAGTFRWAVNGFIRGES